MEDDIRAQVIALYDRYTHEGLERRAFMAEMVRIAGSVAAAEVLLTGIAASPVAAAIVPADDKRLTSSTQALAGGYQAYIVEPRTRSLKPTVLVIHENRGLNDHIRDVARRLAIAGFRAVAPDLLSPAGGTPANEEMAREAIGKLDLASSTIDGVAMLGELSKSSLGGKVGAVGFCWGGSYVNWLAMNAGDKLDAGVVYYGPAPAPSEATRVEAPLMVHLAGFDTRVASTAWPWISALRAAGKTVTYFNYEGVNHAFNNDTSADRYNQPAADLAWQRTLRFFARHLR